MSWQDSGTANFVRVEYPDLAQVLELTDASGPNEVLPPGLAERDRVRLRVTSRVDGVESTATPPSAWFDTWQPAAPKVEDANLPANLSTTVNWSQASSTSARSSKTLAKFDVAGFNLTSAQVGQMVKLTVGVRPAGTVKGALQRWDGKYWRSVLAVPVTKGKAVMYVRGVGRRRTTVWLFRRCRTTGCRSRPRGAGRSRWQCAERYRNVSQQAFGSTESHVT
ncbi:hypothetical protein OG558_16245 [Kribbella sp. NBC_01510]|uniref:hypothetical protein n=1 Tax=Kribbella sp. NBC_01510 TaxID=2903581 RepID=UPI003866F7BA